MEQNFANSHHLSRKFLDFYHIGLAFLAVAESFDIDTAFSTVLELLEATLKLLFQWM